MTWMDQLEDSQKDSRATMDASSKGDARVMRMGTASVPRLVVEFAIPSVVGMLVNGSYAIVNSIFLGNAMGEIGLSAITVANPMLIVFMAFAMLVGNGGNALAALRLGEGKRNEAERALGNVVLFEHRFGGARRPGGVQSFHSRLGSHRVELDRGRTSLREHLHSDSQLRLHLPDDRHGREQLHPHGGRPCPRFGDDGHRSGERGGFQLLLRHLVRVGHRRQRVGVVGPARRFLHCGAVVLHRREGRAHASALALHEARFFASWVPSSRWGFPSLAMQVGMALINFLLNYQLVKYGAMTVIGGGRTRLRPSAWCSASRSSRCFPSSA